jgi:hypothetical protein
MSSSCIVTISNCGSYQISRLCLPAIYQGDDEVLPFTLLDKAGQPLDLNLVDTIEILLYGLDARYSLDYLWPHVTPSEEITIEQSGEGTGLINKGKISTYVPNSYTTDLVAGDLYASVRITITDTSLPNGTDIITFGCVKVADIKFTEINFKHA